jgi:hypothetical protein
MRGNTLLAGFEQSDGTILPTDKLQLAETNLLLSAKVHIAKATLKYVENTFGNSVMGTLYMTSPSQTTSTWCHTKEPISGYPIPIFPIVSADPLRLTILTHTFDSDDKIGNDLEMKFRLVLYTEGSNTQTNVSLGTVKYVDKRRSGQKFLLNHLFEYTPPSTSTSTSTYLAYELEFKQTKPVTLLGNESVRVFNAVQIPDLSGIQ